MPVRALKLAGRFPRSLHHVGALPTRCVRRLYTAPEVPVLYLDRGVIVINKPHGFNCQYNQQVENDATTRTMRKVQELYSLPGLPLIVHRLDKATTGAMIWGLTSLHAGRISVQFKQRLVQKTYLAVVRGGAGCFPQRTGTIEGPMFRVTGGRATTQPAAPELIRKRGDAKSAWELLASSPVAPLSLVCVRPHTGFMHQIRVHMAEVFDAPILGDTRYTGTRSWEPEPAIRAVTHVPDEFMYLHAAELTFFRNSPRDQNAMTAFTVCAPLPDHFVRLCKDLELPLPERYISGRLYINDVVVEGSHPVLEDLGARWMPEPNRTLVATLPTVPTILADNLPHISTCRQQNHDTEIIPDYTIKQAIPYNT